MEAETYFNHLRANLVNHKVSYTRLAANSLLIYVECEPGDKKGVTIWFEPTWHFCGVEGVLIGSRQAQMDDESRTKKPSTVLLNRCACSKEEKLNLLLLSRAPSICMCMLKEIIGSRHLSLIRQMMSHGTSEKMLLERC